MSQVSKTIRKVLTILRTPGERRQFFIETGGVFAIQIGGVGSAFIIQILLARWLGTAAFGDYSFAVSWARLLAIFGSVGLTLSTLKFIPDYIAEEKWGHLRGAFRAFSLVVLVASSILALIAMGVFLVFPPADINLTTLIIGLSLTPLIALVQLYVEYLRGMGHVLIGFAPMRVGQNVGLMVLAGIAVATGTLTNVVAVSLLGVTFLSILLFQASFTMYRMRKIAAGNEVQYELREWIRTSLPMLLIRGFAVIMNRVDVLMVGLLLGAAPTGIYAVALRTADLTSFSLLAVNAVTSRRISPLYKQGRMEELESIAKRATLVSFFVSMGTFAGIVLFSNFLLSLFGEDFLLGRNTLLILGFGHVVNAAVGPVGFLMHLTGHQNISSRVYGVSMVMNIVLNYVLIQYAQLGIEGAAIATAATMIFQNTWMYIEVRRHLKMSTLYFI